jgi:hypothetical protein
VEASPRSWTTCTWYLTPDVISLAGDRCSLCFRLTSYWRELNPLTTVDLLVVLVRPDALVPSGFWGETLSAREAVNNPVLS